jgi:uncharacterized repeat protein (TIGR01451 family)
MRMRSLTLLILIVWSTSGSALGVVSASEQIPNAGFEIRPSEGLSSWDWPREDWIWDEGTAHEGSRSARVSQSTGAPTSSLWSPHIPVRPSTLYTLTYWLRTQDATSSPTVYIHEYAGTDTQEGAEFKTDVDIQNSTNDWFQVSTQFQTRPNASSIRIQLFLWANAAGTFWFDDFALDEGSLALYPYQSGFPVKASSWVVLSSPSVADIDADGDKELIVATGTGTIDGWNHNGVKLPKFPLQTGDNSIFGQIALGDLDGDNDLEIVAGTQAAVPGRSGRVFIWHHTGTILEGWPKAVAWSQYASGVSDVRSVVLTDIDNDDDLEVLAGTTNNIINYSGTSPPDSPNLYAWNADGSSVPGDWPNGTPAIFGAIAAGDLNGDGTANVIAGRDHHFVYAYASDGSHLQGWPVATFLDANTGRVNQDTRIVHFNSAPAIADLDQDGIPEYIVAGNVKYPGDLAVRNSGLLVLKPNGERKQRWETAAIGNGILYQRLLPRKAPAIGDLDQDGELEIVVATYDGWIRAYKADQSILWAYDFARGDRLFASEAVIGDIDGDSAPEIIFGTYDPTRRSQSVGLWGLEADGTPISGFPLAAGAVGIRAAPTLADLDSDGDLEILAAGWSNNQIFVWDTPAAYIPSRLPWPTGRHDLHRTASYTDLRPNLETSRKFANRLAPSEGDRTTYVIRLSNTGSTPFTHTVRITDTLPGDLRYVAGSMSAPIGTVDDTGDHLRWNGVMSDTRILDITYDVIVTTDDIELIDNFVTIDTAIDGKITRTSTIIANGWSSFFPTITRLWMRIALAFAPNVRASK